jgi:two-component sensor histidine kinase
MQVIQAMLILQGNELKDPRSRVVLQEIGTKIQGMAMVHEMLYRSKQLTCIDLKVYIQDLIALLHDQSLTANQVSFTLDLESQMVPIEIAIPCGLILNELVTNALKHAFPDSSRGEIRVRFLREEEDWMVLEVADDGIGLPPGFDFRQSDSLGLRTVIVLGELQLEGEVDFRSPPGVTCQVRFNSPMEVE